MAEASQAAPATTAQAPGKAPAEAKAPSETAVATEIRRMKLKVDGHELDLPEDEVIKLAQMGKSASKRYEEAAALRRESAAEKQQAEQFFGMLRDPQKLAKLLADPRVGIDVKKWAEQYVWDQIQEERLSPAEKKARDNERKLAEIEDRDKNAKAEADKQQDAALISHYEGDYEKKITEALGMGGVPKTPMTVRRMAHYMRIAFKNDLDITPRDLVDRVRQDFLAEQRELFGAVDGDALIGLLGEDTAKRLRNADLKRLKTTQGDSGFRTPEPKPIQAGKKQKDTRLNGSDWRAQIFAEQGITKRKRG